MGIQGRVRRLEHFHRTGECPLCHGEPPWEVSTVNEIEPVPQVSGCPRCGKVNQIVVRYVQKQPLDGRKIDWGPMLSGKQLAEMFD